MKSSLKTSVIGRKESANIRETLRAIADHERFVEEHPEKDRIEASSSIKNVSIGTKSDSAIVSGVSAVPAASQTTAGRITELERENKYLLQRVQQLETQAERLRVENLSLIKTAAAASRRARRSKHRSREHKSKRTSNREDLRDSDSPRILLTTGSSSVPSPEKSRSPRSLIAGLPLVTASTGNQAPRDKNALLILAQSVVRGFSARNRYQNICSRREAARELLRTEQTYNAHLQLVVKMYFNPLRELAKSDSGCASSASPPNVTASTSGSLSPPPSPLATAPPAINAPAVGSPPSLSQINSMFRNIEEVLSTSYDFLVQLELRLQRWHCDQLICDAFVQMINTFDCLVEYVRFFDVGQRAIRTCVQTNPWFANYLRIVGCLSDRKTLGDLLILPVQRCPRYVLILHRILKHTPVNHPDRKNTVEALEKLLTLTEYIEQKKKLSDDLLALSVDNNAKAGATDVESLVDRVLVREGMLVDVEDGTERFVVLFNDALVASQDKGVHGSRVSRRQSNVAPVKLKSLNEIPLTHLAKVTAESQPVDVGGQSHKFSFTVSLRQKTSITPPLPERLPPAPLSTGGLVSPRAAQLDSEGLLVLTKVTYSCRSASELQAWVNDISHCISVLREREFVTGGLERPAALLNRNSWKHIKHVVRTNANLPWVEEEKNTDS